MVITMSEVEKQEPFHNLAENLAIIITVSQEHGPFRSQVKLHAIVARPVLEGQFKAAFKELKDYKVMTMGIPKEMLKVISLLGKNSLNLVEGINPEEVHSFITNMLELAIILITLAEFIEDLEVENLPLVMASCIVKEAQLALPNLLAFMAIHTIDKLRFKHSGTSLAVIHMEQEILQQS